MKDTAEKLGCRQPFLSQIETTRIKQRTTKNGEIKTDKIAPNLAFLIKSMDVYGLDSAERLDFLLKVLMKTEKIEMPLKTAPSRQKHDLLRFLPFFA